MPFPVIYRKFYAWGVLIGWVVQVTATTICGAPGCISARNSKEKLKKGLKCVACVR